MSNMTLEQIVEELQKRIEALETELANLKYDIKVKESPDLH